MEHLGVHTVFEHFFQKLSDVRFIRALMSRYVSVMYSKPACLEVFVNGALLLGIENKFCGTQCVLPKRLDFHMSLYVGAQYHPVAGSS